MDVELLVVADCPNEILAAALLRTALDDVGLSHVQVATTVVGSQERAEQRHFPGSPTILIDGVDPFADVGHAPALACRVYPGPAGPSGIPDLQALREVLKQVAGTTDSPTGARAAGKSVASEA